MLFSVLSLSYKIHKNDFRKNASDEQLTYHESLKNEADQADYEEHFQPEQSPM